ncbi:hypothetical protein DFH07DRAFT_953545 [Mycena maculata]|uniref:Uncharacterized protein n=1 Tax=Mycena maculata TaxID=230809 RepID=A0AAD7JTD3_9AGAR|nr:hypothetical protein DFH07DRAFT_953545 [Mycena maculata]
MASVPGAAESQSESWANPCLLARADLFLSRNNAPCGPNSITNDFASYVGDSARSTKRLTDLPGAYYAVEVPGSYTVTIFPRIDESNKGVSAGTDFGDSKDKEKQCKLDEYRETWKCKLNESWHSDPDAPSRSNQLWTPLGYVQYYIPYLEEGNKSHPPSFKLEYVTYGRGA